MLFSDGVSEALNSDDSYGDECFYGDERLLAVLSAAAGAPAADIVARVMADVRVFAAGAKQSDDIAVLAVRYAAAAG